MHDFSLRASQRKINWPCLRIVAVTVAAVFAGGAILYRTNPERAWWMPPCLFHKLTGLYCPGCGTARGLYKLLHGNLIGAWRMNPLMVITVPLLVYLVVRSSTQPRTEPKALPVWLPWVIVGGIIAYWVLRNIPAYPFTLLAPH